MLEENLIWLLNTKDKNNRVQSAKKIQKMGLSSERVVVALSKALEKALDKQDFETVEAVIKTIRSIGSNAKTAAPALIKALQANMNWSKQVFNSPRAYSKHVAPKAQAIETLGEIGSEIAAIQLIEAIRNESGSIKILAVNALEKIGPKAEIVTPVLLSVMNNKDFLSKLSNASIYNTFVRSAISLIQKVSPNSENEIVNVLEKVNAKAKNIILKSIQETKNS
ncbi:HEAT repeat domain-containing protein [Candidatus Uabimicrobium sp. HlEnr_7]|uniref:HEAT repeat domain-containing protein n=1 Tax=Candidatus Uabimicrobium helgolandensis TaxID=3095367 RepID=UPI0035580C97